MTDDDIDTPAGFDPYPDVRHEDTPSALKLIAINKAMDEELEAWDRDKMNLAAFGISTINLDNQIWALVEYIKVLIPEFDEAEYDYRWKSRMLLKINELRNEVKKRQTVQDITQGIIGPNGAPINVDRNHA